LRAQAWAKETGKTVAATGPAAVLAGRRNGRQGGASVANKREIFLRSPAIDLLSGTICFPSIESYYSVVTMRRNIAVSGTTGAANKKNKGECQ
jgi:hypothetical protein